MYQEGPLDKILNAVKRLIPKSVFGFFQPAYHRLLAWTGALRYGFPGRHLKVIGVTGTKGKSTVVYMISQLLAGAGHPVAAIGSLGYRIGEETWPNTLKMTMPGRWKMQHFLRQAVAAGCTHVVIETPSEGLAQGRHLGIDFDCAVFTNLHKEHLEAHGSYENYRAAKGILFAATPNLHVLNADDSEADWFANFPSRRRIFYGLTKGDMRAQEVLAGPEQASFTVYGTRFDLKLGGRFNVSNALAALATVAMYEIDLPTAKPILEAIPEIPGRLQWIQRQPFGVVVDYAHTPDSLEVVYQTLKPENHRLICVLGSAGGGRDRWKRKEFGRLAQTYCDQIILTDEDPFDEDPQEIINQIRSGISEPSTINSRLSTILDRKQAIEKAISVAEPGDVVVITGKGSETSMALAHGRKIPWSDAQIVRDLLEVKS